MSALNRLHLGLTALVLLSATGRAMAEPTRIVSVGGAVTEIVYALGEEDRLIARDTTSTWPAVAEALPDVGYMRALSAEGVLSVGPDLVMIEEGSGPPETLDLLRSASVPIATIPVAMDAEGILARIDAVAEVLEVPEKGAELHARIEAELAAAETAAATQGDRKRVLFVLSTQGGRIMASGTDTSADGIIAMAGGENAVTGFQGYKLMTDEAVLAARPDVVLMMDRSGDHAADNVTLFALPALATTPAAATQSVVRMDGLLMLGFGPRTAEAVTALHRALYGEAG
jgi:iron complex transport system substrate-binding protein